MSMPASVKEAKPNLLSGVLALLYGIAAYLVFVAASLYAIGFLANLPLPTAIDKGHLDTPTRAIAIDLALLLLFAAQHSVMARPAFKRLWTRIIPASIERSTYVLLSSLIQILLFWQWRPIQNEIWTVTDPLAIGAITALFWIGWAVVFSTTYLLNHYEFFGLSQVMARFLNRQLPAPAFRTPLFYKFVRHPLYFGFLLAFWATPTMTAGHLLFALATTGYILVGIQLEERDLIQVFGDQYRRYRKQVSMLIPMPRRN